MAVEFGSFVRGFVAKLVAERVRAIEPYAPQDRRGFQAVVDLLDSEIAALRQNGTPDRETYMALVRLRNSLKASSTGSFDSFETALRNLQLSLTSSPNPFYEEIGFNISQPYAEAMFNELSDPAQALVGKAVDAFLRERISSTHNVA